MYADLLGARPQACQRKPKGPFSALDTVLLDDEDASSVHRKPGNCTRGTSQPDWSKLGRTLHTRSINVEHLGTIT